MSSRLAVALFLAFAATGCDRQSPVAGQANGASPDEAAAAAPADGPARAAGAVDRSHRGEMAATTRLADLDGRAAALADFRGRPVLVNLWATWCAPCVAELPSLDRAAAGVTALAVNQGEEAGKVRPFLASRRLTHLRPLLDAEMAISMGLPANLPTTLLYDAQGREVWRVSGGRDWASAESRRLLAEAG